jgi:hypothetical protein
MNDPWQILILDANTATEKDVKAAYARLLKQHRPDTDPQGFRRVREAYEVALAMVRQRDAEGTPIPSYASESGEGAETDQEQGMPEETASSPPAFELPEAVQPSLEEMQRAAEAGHTEQIEAALQAFHEACESSHVEATVRSLALERAFAGDAKLLAPAIPDRMLLRLAELGQVSLPHLVLSVWTEEGRHERVRQFGRAMLDQARQLASPDGAILMARVGVVVGLESPALATDLGNRAFPHLPVDARTQIMGRLEHEAALGKIFEEVTPAMKPFWFERLRNNQEAHDWSDSRSLRALEDLVQRNRYVWHGWGIIQQMLPPERWAQVEGRLQQQAQQVAQSTPSAASFPTWIVIPILIIGLNVLRFVGSDSSSFRSKPSYAPTMYDKSERERWEKERREKEIFESVWNATKPSSTVDPNGKLTIPSVMDPPG